MFEFTVSRNDLLPPLLIVSSAVSKKNNNPLLLHVLLEVNSHHLTLTATDLDIEITAQVPCLTAHANESITVPAKKIVDIVRSLEDDASPCFQFKDEVASIRVGRSFFKLATLPSAHFPRTDGLAYEVEFEVPKIEFMQLLQSTQFALSQQDVRVFLNCLLFECDAAHLVAVGTDGHRMAIAKLPLDIPLNNTQRMLVPRKAIQEMVRLVQLIDDAKIRIFVTKKYIKLVTQQYTFSSKLIDSRFPLYTKAIPLAQDKRVVVARDLLKRALLRIVILANEKSRAILLHIQSGLITLIANNQEKEEAIESLEVETHGDELKIGINAVYLLDVLNFFDEGLVHLSFSTADSSVLIESRANPHYQYIIMPMKL